MDGNWRLRLVIIMVLVGAIVAAAFAMPLWIEQITGTPGPRGQEQEPFYTPTPVTESAAATDIIIEPTTPPTDTPRPVRPEDTNCTYGVSYWLSHQDSWKFAEVRIADQAYSKAEVVSILGSNSSDVAQVLLRQIFLYTLNIQRGADQSVIFDTFIEAHDWLNAHPTGSVITESDRHRGLELNQMLNEFNIGYIGPGPCPEVTDTPTPSPTPTPTPTPTFTATATATPTPTVTNTAIPLPPELLTPVARKTRKEKPTSPPPAQPPPPTDPPLPPTDPPPPPTDPPPPPTEPPPPPIEPTEVKLPTAAPTPEP